MRIFSCEVNDAIKVGDDVEVTVIDLDDGQVTIGVDTPEGHKILTLGDCSTDV